MSHPLYFNGRYTTTAEPVLSVEDRGFQFGDSVYEVLKFLDRTPLFLEEHWDRFVRGLQAIRIAPPWPHAGGFHSVCDELIRRVGEKDGIVYAQVTRGVAERSHFYPQGMEPTVVMYGRSWTFPDEGKKRRGVSVITTEDIRWKHCDVKSVNLLGSVLAKQRTRDAGADEALFVHQARVTEGASSSFFLVREGRIVTHPADEEILPGTVRDRVIALALSGGIRVDERPVLERELYGPDEAFLTSTTQGVMPVTSIDGRIIGEGIRGPVTQRLQNLYDDLERRIAAGES